MKKTVLLIDGENILEGIQKIASNPKLDKSIDWNAFFEYFENRENKIIKATLFISQDYIGWSRSSGHLMHNLYEERIETMPTYVTKQTDGYQKSILDSNLIVEALTLAYERPHIQVFIICSGDKDFYPLALKLLELGKTVYFVSLPSITARIIKENFEFIDLTLFIKHPTGGV